MTFFKQAFFFLAIQLAIVNAYPSRSLRHGCATRDFNFAKDMDHESMIADLLEDTALLEEEISVSVVFHVIHMANVTTTQNGNVASFNANGSVVPIDEMATGYLLKGTIMNQFDVLVQDYNETKIRFSLENINYVYNPKLFEGVGSGSIKEKTMKSLLRQGTAKTLNIYTTTVKYGINGWATFPQDYAKSPKIDGVVISHTTVPGGSDKPYNLGRTLTHEVGHWLGLYHTFQNSCSFPNDFVEDTRAEKKAKFGCYNKTEPIITCIKSDFPAVSAAVYEAMDLNLKSDPTRNYMNYVEDACMDTFTVGQAARIRAQWAIIKSSAI